MVSHHFASSEEIEGTVFSTVISIQPSETREASFATRNTEPFLTFANLLLVRTTIFRPWGYKSRLKIKNPSAR
jgi:hypothetical protein